MEKEYYNRDTIDAKLDAIHSLVLGVDGKVEKMDEKVDTMDGKVTYTNGKVKKIILTLSIVSAVVLTLLFENGSSLGTFILSIIK